MAIPAQHVVTSLEIQKTHVLGFRYRGQNTSSEAFINTYFPGLNLFQFLNEIDKLLNQVASQPINKVIGLFKEEQPGLLIQYYNNDYDDPITGLALSRKFTKFQNELVVEHDYFVLPLSARGTGIGKQILYYGLTQYIKMGVDKIKVHAALQDGGYIWARALFKASIKSEVDVILWDAEDKLPYEQFVLVKRIYDHYYSRNPDGKAFPIVEWSGLPFMQNILRGSNWHGEIDLNNSEDLFNFKMYVSR